MKTPTFLTLILTTGLFSCTNGDTKIKKSDNYSADTNHHVYADTLIPILKDTIKRFSVDDYPLTDEMLNDTTSDDSSFPKKSGDIHSFDKAWFTNEALNQTLVFELYTDKHRLVTFHFINDDIPITLIDRMELHTAEGKIVSLSQKEKNFRAFIKSAIPINRKYFETNKGFKLGDNKHKALSIYGIPDKKTIEGGFEIFEWDYVGDILYNGKDDLKGKPLAKDNYGHQAKMIFKNNKLMAIILHNDIP
ncbi:MAG: hypothetical protein ACSLE0_00355 [Chitinophagaceae bacterium]